MEMFDTESAAGGPANRKELDAQRRGSARISYNEDKMSDREFEKLLRDTERPPAKRARLDPCAQGHKYSGQLEQDTAWAVGFNAKSINEEEEELLPSSGHELCYVQMRNYVLARWRSDASRYLSEDEVLSGLPSHQREYAMVAWRFLDTAGYINFGVSPALLKLHSPPADCQETVLIVGAGFAGLAAAQHLRKLGFKPVVIEGHSRPGGRVYTKKLEANGIQAVADLGGSVLTGIDGNPLAVLARQLQIPMHNIEHTEVPIYMQDGKPAPKALDEQAEEDYNRVLDLCSEFRDGLGEAAECISLGTAMEHFWRERCASHASASASPKDMNEDELRQRLFAWHTANLEFANAASIKELSVRSWDQDDPHELPGAHCFLPGGNLRLIAALTQGVPVIYNSRVKKIAYAADGVAVQTDKHVFKGSAALVTVPLGVLKKGSIEFSPPLTQRKLNAIQRLGFGLLNKIVLLFKEPFWGKADMFGSLPESMEKRGEYYLFYSYAGISGGAVLAALVSGEAAKTFEEISPEEATARVMSLLCGIFTPKGIQVPAPLLAVCTRWGKDEMAFGSYSSMGVGGLGGEDYDVLAENIGGRLFFAGEATTKKYPATMHGAFLSGQREAANIAAVLQGEAIRAACRDTRNKQGVGKPVQYAEEELTRAELVSFYTVQLDKVFSNPRWPPEAEFDCFAAVGGPPGGQWAHRVLVRIDVGAAKGRMASRKMHIFVTLSATDLYRLRDIGGGTERRFAFLANLPGLKLVGRQGLTAEDEAMLQAIFIHRGLATKPATPAFVAASRRTSGGLPNGGKAQPAPKFVLAPLEQPRKLSSTPKLLEY